MRRLIVFLLIFTAGCATLKTSEPVVPELALQTTEQKEPLPAPPAEPGTPPSIIPEKAVEPAPTAPVTAEPIPPEPAKPSTTAKITQPVIPRHKTKKAADEGKTPPISDRKLQSLVELAERNDEKIMNVFVGMYQNTVKSIMSDRQNPYKRQTINGSDDQVYEVVFYLTREPRKGKPISDRMLTPVIFRQGKVVAIGAYQYKKLQRTGSISRQKPAGTTIRDAS